MQENYLLCVLEDIYTKAERTLIDAGRFEEVQQARNAFQETMEERFSRAVEELTGRRVVGFLSQVRADPDIATEIFILEPDGKKGITILARAVPGRTLDPSIAVCTSRKSRS
jgi:uncharacterized protein YbcI